MLNNGHRTKIPRNSSFFVLTPVQDFEVLETIARGAFGNVVKVCSTENKAVYAMKIMRKSRVIVEGAVKQCKDEAVIQVTMRADICETLKNNG